MYSRKRSETRSDYKASDLLFTPPRTSLLTINQERQSKQKSDSSSHQPASSSIRTPNDAPPVTSLRNNVSFQYSQTPNNRATPARKFDAFSPDPVSIRRNRVSKNATPFACDASPVPPPVTPLPLAPSSTRRAVTRAAREDVRISAFPATKHVTNEVIVFGYPPQKAAMVLKRFHKYGTIIKRVDGAGNWTHITYMEPAEAQMALTQNGKVIDFDTMIGVKMVRAASSDRDGGLGMGLGGIDSEPNQSSRVSTFSSRMDAERTPLHSRLANKGRGLGSITGAGAGIGLRERGRPAVGPGSGLGVSSRNGGHVGALSSKNIMADKSGRYLNAFPRKSFCTKLKEHLFNW